MRRRTVLKLIAAGVLPGPNGLVRLAFADDEYRPEFFSSSQFEMLDALTEIILPHDDHSLGANAAKVARYIDVIVADGTPEFRMMWSDGLATVASFARERYQKDFASCDARHKDAIVAEMARNEHSPATALEHFFAILKRATVDGYYTSRIGIHQELGYKGNTAIDEFPGCSHQEHM